MLNMESCGGDFPGSRRAYAMIVFAWSSDRREKGDSDRLRFERFERSVEESRLDYLAEWRGSP